jgi:DNA-binding response OmpR family regulator
MTLTRIESTGTLHGQTILVIEDDPIIGIDLVGSLEAVGARVIGPADRIADAMLAITGEEPFDAAILDAHLADGAALDILDALDARAKPYILVTGDENFALRYAPDAPCVPKPVDMSKVIGLLAAILSA